jgi:surface polysaccharide O-acyltransferase-like enzyme
MRKDFIDWLRNIAILFLFPYHTARVFDTFNSFYVKGITNSFSTNLVYISFWFMPVLFLLAGFSSFYALQKRPWKLYLKERFLRLFVPFIFGVLIIVPPQAYYAKLFHHNNTENYLSFIIKYFTDFSDWSEYAGGISPAHLWFILFLFIISIIVLPVMVLIIKKQYSPKWMRNPIVLVLIFVFLTALSLLPDMSGKNIFLYCGYFLIGFCIATKDEILDVIEKYRKIFGAITILGIIGLFIEFYSIGIQENVIFRFIHYFIYWSTLLAILGYGKRYLNRKSKFLEYFNQAAFPVYILHQTWLVIVGYYVLQFTNHGIMPYILIMGITFFLSLILYEVIKRIKILRVMFGIK